MARPVNPRDIRLVRWAATECDRFDAPLHFARKTIIGFKWLVARGRSKGLQVPRVWGNCGNGIGQSVRISNQEVVPPQTDDFISGQEFRNAIASGGGVDLRFIEQDQVIVSPLSFAHRSTLPDM